MCASVCAILLLIGAVYGHNDIDAKLRFYHNSLDNYTELYIDEADQIVSTPWYSNDRTTVVFVHGFTGHPGGPAVKAVITEFIAQGNSNVALLNWDKLAAHIYPTILNSYMNWAAPNAIQLGADFSKTLLKLAEVGLNLNNSHLIGLSLGAHVLGIAGNQLLDKGVELPWITALDPATGFDSRPAPLRLNPSSARFVSVIHTDPNKYGTNKQLGFVDFWPNFRIAPVVQPGCPTSGTRFSEEDFCSHNRAFQYLVDAMKHPGTLIGSNAKNFRTWRKYSEVERKAVVLELGVKDFNAAPGNYYFVTNSESPYGLGEAGL